MMIIPKKEIPDFLVVNLKRFRVLHRDQLRRCFQCRQEGHIKAVCPSKRTTEVNPKAETINDNGAFAEVENEDLEMELNTELETIRKVHGNESDRVGPLLGGLESTENGNETESREHSNNLIETRIETNPKTGRAEECAGTASLQAPCRKNHANDLNHAVHAESLKDLITKKKSD